MISIRRINTDDELYPAECVLREEVLLRAVGFDFASFARDYPFEDRVEHYVAVLDRPDGAEVVGCALLLRDYPDPGHGKVMQVAVNPQLRGQGVGRSLMAEIESRAFGQLGLAQLFCHAQLTAVPFYARIGWLETGEVFQEAGIDHRRMVMPRPDPPSEPPLY